MDHSQHGSFNNPMTISGLLDDPRQLNQLSSNPLFNIGMGLLAHRQDKSVNPFTTISQSLRTSGQEGRTQDKEDRDEELRRMLAEFFANQQGGGQDPSRLNSLLQQGGQQPGIGMPGQAEPGRADYYRQGWADILGQ